MLWVIFAVLAAFLFATANIIDKFLMSNWIDKPIIPMLILGLISVPTVLFFYFFYGFMSLSFFNLFLALLAGAFFGFSNLLYFKIIKMQDISVVIPLFYFEPLVVLIIAFIFLGEAFTFSTYLGIFLLVSGAVLVSLNARIKFYSAKFLVLLFVSILFYSVETVIVKYLLEFADFWTVFSFGRIGMLLVLIPFYFIYFKNLKELFAPHNRKILAVISLSEVLGLTGYFSFTVALSFGFVSLVSALVAVQPFFVLFFAVLLSFFWPSVLRENTNLKTIALKFIAIFLMFAGAVLII